MILFKIVKKGSRMSVEIIETPHASNLEIESDENVPGTETDDHLAGGGGNDHLDGGAGNDSLNSGDGDDVLIGGDGNNTLVGGNGTDTAVYTGNRNCADIHSNGDGTYTITHGMSHDTLSGVERVSFDDASMSVAYAIELHDKQSEVSRFYNALFGRDPDEGGLAFWVNSLVGADVGGGGNTINNAAQSFSESAEFQHTYGASVSNEDFINLMYQNILHRTADQGGHDFWLNAINHNDNRGEMIVNFSNSVEYVAETATTVDAFLANVSLNNYILG